MVNMKLYKNKKIISITAVVVLIAIVISTVWVNSSIANAARFPGVDLLIEDTTVDNPLTILEVVADEKDASFGFYLKGMEPFKLNEDGSPMSFEEAIASFETTELRNQYIADLTQRLDGKYKKEITDLKEYPIEFEEYTEKYFLDENDEGWKKVNLNQYQTVEINGEYVLVPEAEDGTKLYGDYTLGEAVYVVAPKDANGNRTGNYVESIAAFRYDTLSKAYNVEFTQDVNEAQTEFGVYTIDYVEAGLIGADNAPTTGTFYILEDGNYVLVDLDNLTEELEAGTLLYSQVYVLQEGAQEGWYVKNYEFAYDDATGTYTGQYAAIHPVAGAEFVDIKTAGVEYGTHNLVEAGYQYTPGMGNYDFIPSDDGAVCEVQIDAFYYKGGFVQNNNWFRKYVLTLEQDKIDVNALSISVKTVLAEQLTSVDLEKVDLVVFNGDAEDAAAFANVSAEASRQLIAKIKQSALPFIMNSDLMLTLQAGTPLYDTLSEVYRAEDADKNFVNGSVYWYTGDIFNIALDETFTGDQLKGFEEIQEYIKLENKYLATEGDERIEERISQAVAIQYILGKQSARDITNKTQLTILELQPCADFSLNSPQQVLDFLNYTEDQIPEQNITIDHMTTAEFIGKIEDLNGKYDFIYIGMNTGLMNTDSNGDTKYNDSYMDGLVYTHTGDAVIADTRLSGQLNTDFVMSNPSNYYVYAQDVYKIRTALNSQGKLVQTYDEVFYNASQRSGTHTYEKINIGNVGVYRYSGNDITADKLEQLNEYMAAGYPVILHQGFFNGQEINDKKVDNSSYLYEFLQENWDKPNMFNYEELSGKTEGQIREDFNFYMNIPKLNIVCLEDGLPPSVISESSTDVADYLVADEMGRYFLRYEFKIEDKADASPVGTKYTVSLFIDVNSDGRYSRKTENMVDIVVADKENPTVALDVKQLEAGKTYIVTRQIPDGFKSVIPWKLEVSQTENANIRNSIEGYAGIKVDTKTKIKILQIAPNQESSLLGKKDVNHWNMQNDMKDTSANRKNADSLYNILKQVENFEIELDYKFASDVESECTADPNCFDKYGMLIIGFNDVYGEFSKASTVDAILRYIESGKTVLFTHDTTSFVNTEDDTADNKQTEGFLNFSKGKEGISGSRWGYYLNTRIRDAVGMDRYGITSQEVASILKQGNILNEGTDAFNTVDATTREKAYVAGSNRTQMYPEVQGYTYIALNLAKNDLGTQDVKGERFNEVSIQVSTSGNTVRIEPSGGLFSSFDDKYVLQYDASGSKKGNVSLKVKNNLSSNIRSVNWNNSDVYKTAGFNITLSTSRINLVLDSGNAADYFDVNNFKLYEVESDSSKTIGTYSSYYNLKESTGVNKTGNNNDAAFSSMKISAVNSGQITEYPFKLEDTLDIAATHGQYYQLDLSADKDQDGESDIVVWYCISDGNGPAESDPYSASPNDVRNNYYIYSIGNVFYSGVGHSEDITADEKKLFVNTMIAAYSAQVMNPIVTALDSENVLASPKNSVEIPVEVTLANSELLEGDYLGTTSANGVDVDLAFYYSVYDNNFINAKLENGKTKDISVKYYLQTSEAVGTLEGLDGVAIPVEAHDVYGNVIDVTSLIDTTTKTTQGIQKVPSDMAMESGRAYTAVWKTTSADLKKILGDNEEVTMYIEVHSRFMQHTEQNQYGYTTISFKKVDLFDLD